MKSFLAAAFLLVATASFAQEHGPGTITGTGIDLKEYDHAIAGSINGGVMWGAVNEAEGRSELKLRKADYTAEGEFAPGSSAPLEGTVKFQDSKGLNLMKMQFLAISRADQTIKLSIDGKTAVISIVADKFENNHFHNPTYTATYEGQTITYSLTGEACYNYSTHLAFLILGAYLN